MSKERNVQRQKSVSRNEEEDVLASLIDKSDTIDDKPRRSLLRENLFENKPRSSVTMDSMMYRNTKQAESGVSVQPAALINTIQKPRSQLTEQSTTLPTREPRRGRRNTKIINDPLGLLSTELLPDQSLELAANESMPARESDIHNTKSEESLPEWLGGTKKLENKKVDEVEEARLKDRASDRVRKVSINENIPLRDITSSSDLRVADEKGLEAMRVPDHFSLLFGAQVNQQATIMTMQQQEHELRTAAVLSQQHEQLSKVSDSQHTMLCNQEKQFNALLKLQLEKQALLETQIKIQQERINQYIQTLMAQPISVPSTASIYHSCNSGESEKERNSVNEKEEMENMVKVLQAEKSKLESMLSSVNERHENEVTFQADFYERQIAFLKEATIKLEERAKQEIESLETDYIAKFEKLRNEKVQIENFYKEEIHKLKSEHARHVEELNELHAQNIKLVEREYSNIMKSISRAKQTEDQMMETMTNRKADIENILEKANFIVETIKENNEVIELKNNEVLQLRENYFKTHEDEIQAQKLELNNQNRTLEDHRNKFVETTMKFDARFTQCISELQIQNAQNNQAQEMLGKRAAQLLQEREQFEEKVKWERSYLQILKESWLKEQKRQLKLLTEERETVAAEKAQLEVLNRFKTNSDDIAKIELEAAIKTAQEATASANRERLKWQEKNNELDAQNQILQEKEKLLIMRAKELENLTLSALTKKEEGIKALKDAKHLENQHKEKLGLLQTQFKALIEREKKVATEQYNVAKERTMSLTCETEKPERDMNIPRHFRNEILPFPIMHSTSQITPEFINIMDPNWREL